MLRDLSILRGDRNGNPLVAEGDNTRVFMPSSATPELDLSRPPLHAIQLPSLNPKPVLDQDTSRSKLEKTPSKAQRRGGFDGYPPFRTPEKSVVGSRNRFGWSVVKGEEVRSTEVESSDELGHQLPGRSQIVGLGALTPRIFRYGGKASSVQSDTSSTQSTPTKSVSKPPCFGNARPPVSIGQRAHNSFSTSKIQPMVLNTIEAPHFELKEDPSFWMDTNVQVVIRIRPLNSIEKSLQGYNRCLRQESAQSIVWIGQPEARYMFDHVACESVTQEMLFRVAGLSMVENCLSGYNSCIFAYGQTGSGKTYTMLGEIEDLEIRPSSDRGMTPRIFEFLFARIRAEEESRRDEKLKYNCKCSFLEIYNEQITDLLDPSSTNLLLREDIQKGIYVENLTEFDVESVHDILKLLMQGASNRKVAATNMNRESSRSHSVFTCVIESRWEKGATTNLRFARLNLVDLAGSERQKASGAEGDRLKEAASINKSLSTLGHVIMILADMAHGKHRHVPYRDSKLTFLLQESLGGNSKTMIIANVSPSVCCASESLSTLKFAQRARLVQNNAVVNEDSSGDIAALKHQIRLLKEEILVLKRHNVSRSLSFHSTTENSVGAALCFSTMEDVPVNAHGDAEGLDENETLSGIRISSKQIKSLEATLAGALRREKVSDTVIKKLEAENEQLNCLVRQREEEAQSFKLMLKFREEKIQRMESLLGGVLSTESYVLEEKNALSEEVQLLRTRVDRNPEVTRFALENIRLLDQLRRFRDFYEEGEREILLTEISELRNQLGQVLEGKLEPETGIKAVDVDGETMSNAQTLSLELEETSCELEKCRANLARSIEDNAKVTREINDLRTELVHLKFRSRENHDMPKAEDVEMFLDLPREESCAHMVEEAIIGTHTNHAEDILNLQLELDILKEILKEEKSSHSKTKEGLISNEDLINELKSARSVIEALEYQNFLLINDVEKFKRINDHNSDLIQQHEMEISFLRKKLDSNLEEKQVSLPVQDGTLNNHSPLQVKLNRMQASLEKAQLLNTKYQSCQESWIFRGYEMDEVRKQAEAETAEVIVCLQEELTELQELVEESNRSELAAKESLFSLQVEFGELKDQLNAVKVQVEISCRDRLAAEEINYVLRSVIEELKLTLLLEMQDREMLSEIVENNETELRDLKEFWKRFACEIKEALEQGNMALEDASDCVGSITCSKCSTQIGEQIKSVTRSLYEKTELIDKLQICLEDAKAARDDLELKLRSLRGATMAITEQQQQENDDKEKEIVLLKSQLLEKNSTIHTAEDRIRKAEICAAVAFVISSRLAEKSVACLQELEHLKHRCIELEKDLSENRIGTPFLNYYIENVEDIGLSKFTDDFRAKLDNFKNGVDSLGSYMKGHAESTVLLDQVNSDFPHRIRSQLVKKCSLDKDTNYSKHIYEREETFILLRKELEFALESLEELRSQMVHEKEAVSRSEEKTRENIEHLKMEILQLSNQFMVKEEQYVSQLKELEQKLVKVERDSVAFGDYYEKTKEVLKLEISNTNAMADQKAAEAGYILMKVQEAQGAIEDADLTISALVKAKESAEFEIKKLKKIEYALSDDKTCLITEVNNLRSQILIKEQECTCMERKYKIAICEAITSSLELENSICLLQESSSKNLEFINSGIESVRSEFAGYVSSLRAWLEDIFSMILRKDCAVSVLHLCHLGILLERVMGLNVENSFLSVSLHESNLMIVELKENNARAEKELEVCSLLKGKLLFDINNSFQHIMKNETKASEFGAQLHSFEKKVAHVQQLEESLLTRANSMGLELRILMREFDENRKNEALIKELQVNNSRLLEKVNSIPQILQDSICEEFDLLAKHPYPRSDDLVADSNARSVMDVGPFQNFIEHYRESILIRNAAEEFTILALCKELAQKIEEINCIELKLVESKEQKEILGGVMERIIEEIILSKIVLELRCDEIISLAMENGQLRSSQVHLKNEYLQVLEENSRLQDKILLLENHVNSLKMDIEVSNKEQQKAHVSLAAVSEDLNVKHQMNKLHILRANKFEAENGGLRIELADLKRKINESLENVEEKMGWLGNCYMCLVDRLCHEFEDEQRVASRCASELEILEGSIVKILSENSSLWYKLLQNVEKKKLEKMTAEFEYLHAQLNSKACELETAFVDRKLLQEHLLERNEKIMILEMELMERNNSLSLVYGVNADVKTNVQHIFEIKSSTEEELMEKIKEIRYIKDILVKKNQTLEDLENEMAKVSDERDNLVSELHLLKEKLEMAQALAEEREAEAVEARQIAEERMTYAEEKREEARLLESSIEELECTVNALESKVEIVRGEAERQRVQREEIEMELGTVKCQMLSVASSAQSEDQTSAISRRLKEKLKELQLAEKNIQFLQKEVALKDAEIIQLKTHISELSVHAEAQAREYKQKFKELEIMAQEAKAEPAQPSNNANLTTTKPEKGAAKPRGSGSPFKCIGLGLTQQMNSEKDEELVVAKKRIEELESLAMAKQKEVFMLNTRLAATESMTHDVIRDLLGVKLNVANCASILDCMDSQKVQEAARSDNQESAVHKEREIARLRNQIKDLVEERQSWLEEVNNRQEEITAARITIEKLRQREQLLATENELMKADNSRDKKLAMELELENERLSKQQDLQHRIHHHAKIKEENSILRIQNDELHAKLQRSEVALSRVKDELARYRAAVGKTPYNNLDEEEQLRNKLQESEVDRLQLAHKFVSLCTGIFQAAGFSNQECGSGSLDAAEGALNQLIRKIHYLEFQLEDQRTKYKIYREKIRMAELNRETDSTSE